MRVAIIGRTRMLLDAARLVAAAGHEIPLVMTCRAEPHSGAGPEDFRQLSPAIRVQPFSPTPVSTNLTARTRSRRHNAISRFQ